MKKRNIFIFIILIILIFTGYYIITSKNKNEVDITEDILISQTNLEKNYLNDLKQNNYTFDNPKVILNPYDISPLTAIVMFNTETSYEVTVTIQGKDEKTTITHIFEKNTEHILPIYGLYANYENTIIIKMNNKEKSIKITTESLPESFTLPTNVYADKEKINNDLTFVSPSAAGYTTAYDCNGDVRWYLTDKYAWDVQRLDNGHLMLGSNRPINFPYYTVGLVEIDLSGKIYKEYTLPGGYHHDVFEMEDGNLLVATNDFNSGTVEDHIALLNRETGNIEKTWDLTKILPMDKGKSENWIEHDWFHNNAVWYDKKTNSITLSGRHQDAVINIDYESGDLNWIIGDSTNWGEDMQKYFFKPINENLEWQWSQHASMILPNGNVFVFDNGNNKTKIKEEYVPANESYSRGVMYKINTNDMTIEQVWQYGKERGSEFYSPYISDVDYYNEGHYLVHSGGIGCLNGEPLNQPAVKTKGATLTSITTEILNDEIVFELTLPSNFYRAEKLSLYSNNNLKFGEGKRLGSLGETKPYKERINTSNSLKEIPEKYNLNITKEADRLVLNGDFTKNSNVYLILQNIFNQKAYEIYVSKTPYTAMCIDIFNNKDNAENNFININYYINEENLSGKYNIFIKADDVIYNTGEYVNFD